MRRRSRRPNADRVGQPGILWSCGPRAVRDRGRFTNRPYDGRRPGCPPLQTENAAVPTLVKMPKWGLTMTAGTVTGWIADEGSEVAEGAPLLTVETEKAVNDVEAPAAGVLVKIVAGAGTEVPVSGPVAVIAAPGETLSEEEIATLVSAAGPRAAGA